MIGKIARHTGKWLSVAAMAGGIWYLAKARNPVTPPQPLGKYKGPVKIDLSHGHHVGITLGSKIPSQREISEFQLGTGRRVITVNFFYPFDKDYPFPSETLDEIAGNGSYSIISWEPDPSGPRASSHNNVLKEINRGELDDYMTQWFTKAAEWKGELILRWAHEFNLPNRINPYAGMPKEFVDAYNRMCSIRDRAGATNVLLAWSPNFEPLDNIAGADGNSYRIEDFYPKDRCVNVKGLSGYNRGIRQKRTIHRKTPGGRGK